MWYFVSILYLTIQELIWVRLVSFRFYAVIVLYLYLPFGIVLSFIFVFHVYIFPCKAVKHIPRRLEVFVLRVIVRLGVFEILVGLLQCGLWLVTLVVFKRICSVYARLLFMDFVIDCVSYAWCLEFPLLIFLGGSNTVATVASLIFSESKSVIYSCARPVAGRLLCRSVCVFACKYSKHFMCYSTYRACVFLAHIGWNDFIVRNDKMYYGSTSMKANACRASAR